MSNFFMRLLGVVNLLFVAFGVWYSVGARALRIKAGKWPPYHPARPLDWLLYFAFLALSIALIAWLSYLSVRLIRADRKALLPTCVVFGVEIAYLWAEVVYFWLLAPRWITDRSWFWTMGEDPIAPQHALFYPFLGFLTSLTLFVITRPRRSRSQTVAPPTS
jgi:hypothetical protein